MSHRQGAVGRNERPAPQWLTFTSHDQVIHMSDSTRNVVVQDFGTYPVSASLSEAEVRRQLQTLLGAPWLAQAVVCRKPNGDLEFQRPAAGQKG
jgi:hypothetical protein